jgi:hypothetical protein
MDPQSQTHPSDRMANIVPESGACTPLRVELASFGYTQGAPQEVDSTCLFDVRGLPNPKSHRAYKHLTGEDCELQRQILDTERGKLTYKRFEHWLDAHIACATLSGRTLLRLYVGCKSGQHRSVSIVCRCGDTRAGTPGQTVDVSVSHRDRAHWVTTALMVKCELCMCEIHRNAWDHHVMGKKHIRLATVAVQVGAAEAGKCEQEEQHRKRQRSAQEEPALSNRNGGGGDHPQRRGACDAATAKGRTHAGREKKRLARKKSRNPAVQECMTSI